MAHAVIVYRLISGLWQAVGRTPVTPPPPPSTGGYGLSPYGTSPYGQ
ncbi:hypothetical protein [Spirillospora sp. NBC_01491]|nr:hypothetical protein [Spirillospora sp. NBC_01491]